MFQSPQSHIFPKGLTHAFGQKMPIFSLFLFEIRLEIMLNNLVEKKKTFLDYQKNSKSPKVNPCPWSRNANFFIFCFRSK